MGTGTRIDGRIVSEVFIKDILIFGEVRPAKAPVEIDLTERRNKIKKETRQYYFKSITCTIMIFLMMND